MQSRMERLVGPLLDSSRQAEDRGSVTIQTVLLAPLVVAVSFFGIEVMLWFHARNVALHAAQHGTQIERAYQAAPGDGRVAADQFIQQAGGGEVLRNVVITSQRTGDDVTITVTGSTPSVLGIGMPAVTRSATGPIERVTVGG